MIGAIANQHQALSRRILREHGLEFATEYVCGPRMGRTLHVIIFNRQDPQECQRKPPLCGHREKPARIPNSDRLFRIQVGAMRY
jgi:hypothetical protein